MLHRLGHDALVRRHDQQGQINAAGASQHIADEFFVARHVDDARPAAVRQIQVGEAQLNGDPPLFFLPQPVCLNAGQRPNQAGFAVIHMTGCADDAVVHAVSSRPPRAVSWATDWAI